MSSLLKKVPPSEPKNWRETEEQVNVTQSRQENRNREKIYYMWAQEWLPFRFHQSKMEFPLTSMDSQIIYKDCGGDLDQDIGCYVKENPVTPKSWKSLKALLYRDYCTDTSQPLTLTDGRTSASLPVYFNSFPGIACPFLLFSPFFFLLDFLMLRVALLLQADVSLPVFRDWTQFLEHSSFFLVPVPREEREVQGPWILFEIMN